jgi:hypothetical protein
MPASATSRPAHERIFPRVPCNSMQGRMRIPTMMNRTAAEYFRQVVPGLSRLAIIWHRGSSSDAMTLQALEDAARTNRNTAQALGLSIPQSLRIQAEFIR